MKKCLLRLRLKKYLQAVKILLSAKAFQCLKMRKRLSDCFQCRKGRKISFSVLSDIENSLNFSYVKMIKGGYIVSKNADDYYVKSENDYYPDLLLPLDLNEFTAEYDGLNTVWVQINDDNLPSGTHKIAVSSGGEQCEISVDVIDARLPEQSLIFTNWFHTDCLMSYYGFEAFRLNTGRRWKIFFAVR